ncbi:MAG: M23 family metallopeptidase [Thermodesulfovibrionales bacterium]
MIRPAVRFCFCRQLSAKNNLDIRKWLFYPGMLFGDRDIWWGDRGTRVTPHEGLDFYCYRSAGGFIRPLSDDIRIPVLYDGQIAQIVDDFLGKTVFVRHPLHDEKNRELYSIYGHIRPKGDLSPGLQVRAGDIIGSLATRRERTSAPPPHLHLSAALISITFPQERLGWNATTAGEEILFIDPMTLIDCEYSMLNTSCD